MKAFFRPPIFFLALWIASCSSHSPQTPTSFYAIQQSPKLRKNYEATGRQFVIATQGIAASQAAQTAFHEGGNIIDAAIAASFAISVERPQSTGLGGGGFLLYYDAKSAQTYAVDFRERAPLKATERMYLDKKGEPIEKLSRDGILSVGVPGLVAGLLDIHKKFGKLPRSKVLANSIALAENGFEVYPHLADCLEERKEILAHDPASAKIFLKKDGSPYKVGERLFQKDLAKTLRLISQKGAPAFYSGSIAQALIKTSNKEKGLLTLEDFKKYEVKWRLPVHGTYKSFEVYSMSPPSSGGSHIIEILNVLENDPLKTYGYGSPLALHLGASAMQQAFVDRATFMGDPDFIKDIPLQKLLSKKYAKKIRNSIDINKAKASDQMKAATFQPYESNETTNFSIMDSEGNAVISTQTINFHMGSGMVAEGTGILLNDEMDDFSAKPGASNLQGAIGGVPNSISPRKTPLSSMSPTIILRDHKPVLALGAVGGTRIITCVAQTVLNYLEFGLPLYESVSYLRFHHQWRPDVLNLESPGFSPAVLRELQSKGYKIQVGEVPCSVNAVASEGDTLRAVADPRDLGSSLGE